MPETQKQTGPETQRERWMKYGANVVLASIVVILLAGVVTYAAQRVPRRLDTTKGGSYSLKPQTVNVISDLKQKVKLVSLYTKREKHDASGKEVDPEEYSRPVRDLLEEYQRKGKNIEIEEIDPVENPTKADDLVNDISKRYSSEIKKYKDVVDTSLKSFADMKVKLHDEAAKLRALPKDSFGSREGVGDIAPALAGELEDAETRFDKAKENINRRSGQKLPDYKGATEVIDQVADDLAQRIDFVLQFADNPPKGIAITDAGKKYLVASRPAFDAIKKSADELTKKVKDLGSLKLDEVRTKLAERDAILVIGENDMRSLSFEQVWKSDAQDIRRATSAEDIKPRFAGEQQITAAILALTSEKKPKVAFVRSSGPPMTSPGFPPFQPSGPLAVIAERLRGYNFDVVEKDLSGMYAMQAQMQGQRAEPEPSDEELKDAVWVVLCLANQQQSQMGPPPSIAPKVAAHLSQGGSAMLLFDPQSDNCADALKSWGIEVMTDVLAVHEAVEGGAPSTDFVEQAQREQAVFVTNQYGDHFLAKPIQSLDAVLFPRLVVKKISTTQPVKTVEFLPVPQTPPSWGERDIQSAGKGERVKFDEGSDVKGPIFSGAIAEREGGGRVVVIGSLNFATNGILTLPDPELLRTRQIRAARFPGNSELFTNSVFWLAHMEPLIAISPAAMDVSRIANMSDATLKFWRIGAVLIALPGLVIVAGATMYVLRKD